METRYQTLYTNEGHSVYWIVQEISCGHMVLPLIQRKFVWSMDQMTSLFNSILKGYPINSILLTKIVEENKPFVYKFPESVSNYTISNSKLDKQYDLNKTYSVLDGQQRLTTLYSCFQKDFVYKSKPKGRGFHNTRDYRLFINLSEPSSKDSDGNDIYNIDFKDDENEVFVSSKENSCYFLWVRMYKVMNFLVDMRNGYKSLLRQKDDDLFAKKSLNLTKKFISRFNKEYAINETKKIKCDELLNPNKINDILVLFYERFFEDDSVINCVMLNNPKSGTTTDVFVNLNSGGTYLSYSDLLFTKLTSYFETEESIASIDERDAKVRVQKTILDQINDVVEDQQGKRYLIRPNDDGKTILKALLVINASGSDFGIPSENPRVYSDSIGFNKIEKIDKDLDKINKNWNIMAQCIVCAYNFIVKELHLSYKIITSSYSVIPIILFFWLRGIKSQKDIDNKLTEKEKKELRWYFYSSSLKHVFGRGSGDTILAEICQEIHRACFDAGKDPSGAFDKFYNAATKTNQSLRSKFYISADDIANYLTYEKKNKDTYILLTLLYPEDGKKLDMEADHMHPYSGNENIPHINNIVNLKLFVGHGKKNNGLSSNPGAGKQTLIEKAPSWCEKDKKGKPLFTSDILLVSQVVIEKINACKNSNDENNPLHIKNAQNFFNERRKYIKKKLTDSLVNLK